MAEDDSRAKLESLAYLRKYLKVWADAAESWKGRSSDAYLGYDKIAKVLRDLTPEMMIENDLAVVGSAETAFSKVSRIKELLGIDHILWQVDFGGQPYSCSLRTVQIFQSLMSSFKK